MVRFASCIPVGPMRKCGACSGQGIVIYQTRYCSTDTLYRRGRDYEPGPDMDSASAPQNSVSQKNQEVVDLYESYVAGGFAPYPVYLPRDHREKILR